MYPQAYHFISSIWRAFSDTSLFGLTTSQAWQPLESVQQLVLLLCKQQSETVETKKVNSVAVFFILIVESLFPSFETVGQNYFPAFSLIKLYLQLPQKNHTTEQEPTPPKPLQQYASQAFLL